MKQNWKALYRKDQKKALYRRRWNKYKCLVKILTAIILIYLLITVGGAWRFQGPYDYIQRIAATSGIQTNFGQRSFLDHIKYMMNNPKFAWKCLWISEDDMYTATFLSFEIDAANYKAQNDSVPHGSGNNNEINIYQPTAVDTETYIEHSLTDDGNFSSTILYAFDTDYLVGSGVNRGDICSLRVSIVYRDKIGGIRVTEESMIANVIVGDRLALSSVVLDPDGYISVDDILGYNIK